MGVTVEFRNVREPLADVQARLRPVGIGGYATWLAGAALQYLQARSEQRFAENEPGGGDWAPLTEATANWRTYYGYPPYAPINRRTGQLRELMTRTPADIRTDAAGVFLSYPGREGYRHGNKLRIEQAQGLLIDRNGRRSTPRPVVVLEPQDVMALSFSLQRFLLSKTRGKR